MEKKLDLLFCVLAFFAAAIFLASGIAYLWFGHWPVTHQDFWRIYDVCLNRSWFASATLKYNGHSHFFPSQIWLADLRFWHGDQEVLFIIGLSLLCVSATLLIAPIWRDEIAGTTAKTAATLLLIVGNFWMGRASMTASGGFNCCYSLTLGGAAVTFLWLPVMRGNSPRYRLATIIVICAGVVSTFSFGTGLVVWPTVLLLGYCLRLRVRLLVALAVAALVVLIIFWLLPSREPGSHPHPQSIASHISALGVIVCRLVGAPGSYVATGWYPDGTRHLQTHNSTLSLLLGVAGCLSSVIIVLFAVVRRNFGDSRVQFTGFALMLFNFGALLLIAVGREEHIRLIPAEVAAPRYLYWSTLFWVGLLIVAFHIAWSKAYFRWPALMLVLAVPVLLFPSHYKAGEHWRFARCSSISAATSLINGVRDEKQVQILFRSPDLIYRLAAQLRARHLDMFADKPADWIGRRESELFDARHSLATLRGQARIDASVRSLDGAPAARVSGSISSRERLSPALMLIVDAPGTIKGIARSCTTSRVLSRILYRGKFQSRPFLGYIRDYDPRQSYTIRAVDNGVLSAEAIPVAPESKDVAVP